MEWSNYLFFFLINFEYSIYLFDICSTCKFRTANIDPPPLVGLFLNKCFKLFSYKIISFATRLENHATLRWITLYANTRRWSRWFTLLIFLR